MVLWTVFSVRVLSFLIFLPRLSPLLGIVVGGFRHFCSCFRSSQFMLCMLSTGERKNWPRIFPPSLAREKSFSSETLLSRGDKPCVAGFLLSFSFLRILSHSAQMPTICVGSRFWYAWDHSTVAHLLIHCRLSCKGGGRPSFPPLLSSERKKTLVVQSSGFISDKWLVPARFRFAMHENTFYSILGLGGECR